MSVVFFANVAFCFFVNWIAALSFRELHRHVSLFVNSLTLTITDTHMTIHHVVGVPVGKTGSNVSKS